MKTPALLSGSLGSAVMAVVCLGAMHTAAAPANDMFANRIVITGTNIVVTGSSVGATRQTGEPYIAGDIGGASVWWSWKAPRSETTTISTYGSDFDTLLGVYTGTSVSALTTIASNDDDSDAGDLTSKVVFNAVSNTTYQIAVDGYNLDGYTADSGNVSLSVVLAPLPPPPPAPAWASPDPYGAAIYSSNYAGKVIILDFWATWCGPCKAEMPDLVALQDMYRADGLVIIGADGGWSGDTPQVVQDFLATFTPTINYQIVMANAAMIQAFGGITSIPTTFIIDRQNLIQNTYVGTQSRSTLERAIIPLLYSNARLGCQLSGGQMTLCWPTNALAFTLESATSLTNSSWTTWPTTPAVINGTNTVSVPKTNTARFFRLRMSY